MRKILWRVMSLRASHLQNVADIPWSATLTHMRMTRDRFLTETVLP